MLQRLLQLTLITIFTCLLHGIASATPYEVKNVVVSIQAQDAVKARDLAITKAQRVAFAALVGKNETDLTGINDSQIARIVSGFSVQGERLASRSYRGNFTIRFIPASANNFIISNGMEPIPEVSSGQTISVNKIVTNNAVPTATATAASVTNPSATPAPEEVKAQDATIVVLPILDIGSRRVVWDEPNPWRVIWQKTDHSIPGLAVRVPMGDVEDVTDIPDANFLNNGQANVKHALERYSAGNLYVIVAKNQGAGLNTASGMALSLYRHDGQQLKFIRKTVIHPRPGYLFDDAVPVAMQMIVMTQNNGTSPSVTTDQTVLETENTTTTLTTSEEKIPVVVAGSVTATVPYQSLQQWIAIQRRLRMVPGIKSILPVRVSSSSAQVRINTSVSGPDFIRNLAMQNFSLQKMPGGELALIEN